MLACLPDDGLAVEQGSEPATDTLVISGGSAAGGLSGPDAVPNRLADDRAKMVTDLRGGFFSEWKGVKQRLYDETGLHLGADYNVLVYGATDSMGDNVTATGVGRLFGSWELIGRGAKDTGSLVFKVEHRDAFTDFSATDFAGQLGYVGLVSPVFSDQGFRTTNLYWRQSFLGGRFVGYAGFVDVTDYVDVYPFGSPWTGFSNLAFSTGSGTIGGLPDGALAVMASGFLTENIYAVASIADANADPTDVFGGFETFVDRFETFKSFEIGWAASRDDPFVDNIHVTFWQIDRRQAAGGPGGWGASFSLTGAIGEEWLPFLRGGWAHDGGSWYETSLSAGIGYQPDPGGDLFGIGLNWGRPNSDTYGAGLDDQFTAEVFYLLQLTENIQVTPSIQFLGNPALDPENDFIGLFGLRGRISF